MKFFLLGLAWYLFITAIFHLYKKYIKPKIIEKKE